MSPALRDLDRRTRASLAEASVMRRPLGTILGDATRAALDLEIRGRVKPGEVTRFFDALTRFTQEPQ